MGKRITSEDLVLNLILNADKVESGNKKLLNELYKLDRATRDLETQMMKLNAQKKNLSKSSKAYAADVKNIDAQLAKLRKQITVNRAAMMELRKEIGAAGLTINQLRSHLSALRIQLANATDPKIMARLRKEIERTTLRVERMTTGMSRMAQAWRHMGTLANKFGTLVGYATIAIYGVARAIGGTFKNLRELDRLFSNVMKTTSLTREEVQRLKRDFDELDKADGRRTPTNTKDLLSIARIAGRLGVRGVEEIRDFTLAVDKMYVSLQTDLEGSVEDVTEKVGKLINVFHLERDMPLNEALLRAGSLINELGKSSAANAEAILNYTARLGGVGSMASFTIDQLAGLGATLDANQVKAERGSTALVKLIVGLGKHSEKFARILGVSTEAYRKMLEEDVNGVLIALLEASGKGNKSIMDVVKGMGDMEVSGVRVAEVYGKLTQNLGMLKEQQDIAARAFSSSASVMNEFYIVSGDFDALMAIQGKRVKSLADDYSKKLAPAMFKVYRGMIDFVFLLRDGWRWMVKHSHVIKGTLALIALMKATKIALFIKGIITQLIIEIGYRKDLLLVHLKTNATLVLMKKAYLGVGGGIRGAAAALKAFSKAFWANPWTAAVAIVASLAAAFFLTRSAVDEVKKAAGDLSNEILEQTNAMDKLFKAAENTEDGSTERANAIRMINELYGQYLPYLLTEADGINAIGDAYDYANTKLKKHIALTFENDRFNKIMKKNAEKRQKEQQQMLAPVKERDGAYAYGQAMFETDEILNRLANMDDLTSRNKIVFQFLDKLKLNNATSRYAFLRLIELRKDEINLKARLNEYVAGYTNGINNEKDKDKDPDGNKKVTRMSPEDFAGEKAQLENERAARNLALMEQYKDKDDFRKKELKSEEAFLLKMYDLTLRYNTDSEGTLTGGEKELLAAQTAIQENRIAQIEANGERAGKKKKEAVKKELDLEKYRIAAMEKGRERELSLEEKRAKDEIKTIVESAGSKEDIMKALEYAELEHNQNVTDIKLKYLDKQLADAAVSFQLKVMLLELAYEQEALTTAEYSDRKEVLIKEHEQKMLDFKKKYGLLTNTELMELEIERLKSEAEFALLSEEAKQAAIESIRMKYDKKRAKEFKRNVDKELNTLKEGFNSLQLSAFEDGMKMMSDWERIGATLGNAFSAFFDETQNGFKAFGKALLIMAIDLVRAQVRLQYPLILAKKIAKYALIPGGQLLALKETAVAITLIEASFAAGKAAVSSINTSKKVTQHAKGIYPVRGEDDGRMYNANYVGVPRTGIYNKPSLGLFAEKPELVIDNNTLRNIQLNSPGLIQAIMAHRYGGMSGGGGVQQFATGKYNDGSYSSQSNMTGSPDGGVNAALQQIIAANTQAMQQLKKWKPAIAVDIYEKKRQQYTEIENQSGL